MARSVSRTIDSILGGRRWTPEQAAAVLEAAEASGLGLAAFASHHGVDPQRLQRWRRRLGEGAVEPVRFEEVAVTHSAREVAPGAAGVELVLRSGHVVRLAADFDADALRRLLWVLEPC